MATPQYTAGSAGNILAAFSLVASKGIGTLIDNSAKIQGQVTVKTVNASGSTDTNGHKVEFYNVYHATTLTDASLSVGATTINVQSGQGAKFSVGQKIAIMNADGSNGEIVTISSISTDALTVSALVYAKSGGANTIIVYGIETTPTIPGPAVGVGLANNGCAAKTYYPGTGKWFVYVTAQDANASTVEISRNTVDGLA